MNYFFSVCNCLCSIFVTSELLPYFVYHISWNSIYFNFLNLFFHWFPLCSFLQPNSAWYLYNHQITRVCVLINKQYIGRYNLRFYFNLGQKSKSKKIIFILISFICFNFSLIFVCYWIVFDVIRIMNMVWDNAKGHLALIESYVSNLFALKSFRVRNYSRNRSVFVLN